MSLLSFLTAIVQAFANLPAVLAIWLRDRLAELWNLPVPILIVVALLGALVALASFRTKPARQ